MKPIYIIGAGGAAKEIFLLIKETNKVKPIYEFRGFIDINIKSNALQIGNKKFPVLNETIFLKECKENSVIVFGLGDAAGLRKIIDKYLQYPNFEFPTIVHPSVVLNESIQLGIGNVVAQACIFTVDISLQSFNYINRGVHIGHDCLIGSYNVLNPCAVISGGVIIKDENLVGSNSTILQYLTVGSKNKIGAGAVVTKNVGSDMLMVGVPAKNINK